MKIKIVLADDHKIVREGLKNLLDKEWDIEIIGEADNGRAALQIVQNLDPDIIIMDIGMPQLNGIEAAKRIKEISPEIKIIALSMHSDKQFVTGMLQAGSSGYLLKDCAVDELVDAIRTVVDNKIYLSSEISGIVVNEYMQNLTKLDESNFSDLTDREREVLQLIAEGTTTKNISERLFISVKTVESHRKNIMDKLKLYTVPELTKYAIRSGLTSLE